MPELPDGDTKVEDLKPQEPNKPNGEQKPPVDSKEIERIRREQVILAALSVDRTKGDHGCTCQCDLCDD